MKEKEIKTCIENLIKENITESEAVKVIQNDNYEEERVSNMITVGISNVEQMNFALPDYRYTLNITINSFIADERSGEYFNSLAALVSNIIQDVMNTRNFEDVFGEIPVVGWINFNKQFTDDGESYICNISSDVIASF